MKDLSKGCNWSVEKGDIHTIAKLFTELSH